MKNHPAKSSPPVESLSRGYRDSARLLGECADKKIEGLFGGKIARKSRNSRRARGGEVGAKGMVTQGAILRSPGTKYKRSKNVVAFTSIALTLVMMSKMFINNRKS